MTYEIKGDQLPVVICQLEAGESMITEGGSMKWMSPNMQMETKGGGAGKMFSKLFSGENMFHNVYTAVGGHGMIAFGTSFPGSIVDLDIGPGQEWICQKRAFLAGESGVSTSVHMQEKMSAGFLGGEGFIMQRISGSGKAFIEIDGSLVRYDLQAGQRIVIDTGCLAAMSGTCKMEVERVRGAKNMFLGGEGFFNTVVEGPGTVYLQTMPIYEVARALRPYLPSSKD